MNIYLSQDLSSMTPDGFDAVSITIDASLRSLLEWKPQIQQAQQKLAEGKKLFWVLDFGGYDLEKIDTFRLAVEHFEKEIWDRFGTETTGVCLYQGRCDLDQDHVYFLEQLAGSLPDEAEPFVLLDASFLSNPIEVARAISKERFPHFTVAVKGIDQPLPEFGWEDVAGTRGMLGQRLLEQSKQEPTVAVCIPSEGVSESLEEAVAHLKASSIPFRMIPEALITSEWYGLDHIIVDGETVDHLGMRRLMGFCAAGGTVVSLEKELGLPLEVNVDAKDPQMFCHVFCV